MTIVSSSGRRMKALPRPGLCRFKTCDEPIAPGDHLGLCEGHLKTYEVEFALTHSKEA